MNTLAHILWFKNLMFWKLSSKQNLGTMVRNVGSFLVFGSFAMGAFYFSNFLTAYLLETVRIGSFLFHRFIGMALFIFFVMINLGNIVVSYSTLYRSPEVQFLLTTPVSYVNIFVIKFLDNFFYSSGTLFMIGISVLLGYGVYFGHPWHFYVFVMFGVLIPFMLLAACIAVIVLLVIMKLAATISFRTLIAVVVILYCAQVYAYFKITSPINLVQEVMRYYPYVDIYFGSLDPSISKMLPNFWVSEILYFYARHNYSAVAGYVLILILTTAGFFVFALACGNAFFYQTWLTSLSFKSLSKKFNAASKVFGFSKKSIFSPQVEVILKKEFWQFVREPGQWIHLAVIMVLLAVFLSSVTTLNIKLESPDLKAVVYLVVFIFNIFLINSIALRFGFPMVSLEGKAYWSLRSSPVAPVKMYWTKFAVIIVFLGALSMLIAWLSNFPYLYKSKFFDDVSKTFVYITPHESIQQLAMWSIAVTPIVTLTLSSLNFGLGSAYADFVEKNPIRIASSQGATMTFLLSVVYLVFILAIYYFPTTMFFQVEGRGIPLDVNVVNTALAVISVFSLIIIGVSHLFGVRSLQRDF